MKSWRTVASCVPWCFFGTPSRRTLFLSSPLCRTDGVFEHVPRLLFVSPCTKYITHSLGLISAAAGSSSATPASRDIVSLNSAIHLFREIGRPREKSFSGELRIHSRWKFRIVWMKSRRSIFLRARIFYVGKSIIFCALGNLGNFIDTRRKEINFFFIFFFSLPFYFGSVFLLILPPRAMKFGAWKWRDENGS